MTTLVAPAAPTVRMQNPAITKVFYQRLGTAWIKAHGKREETLQGAVARFFREQGEQVVAGVRRAGESFDPEELSDKLVVSSSTKRLLQYVERPLFQALAAGAQ